MMEILCFVAIAFAVTLPLVLAYNNQICREHNRVTGKIINYDSTMREFVYKVYMTREEIINLLNIKNECDELSCDFDFDRSVIKFSEYGSNREYYFQIQECNGYSILRLEQVALIGMKSHVPYKLNPFIVSKLPAEIVPYALYCSTLNI